MRLASLHHGYIQRIKITHEPLPLAADWVGANECANGCCAAPNTEAALLVCTPSRTTLCFGFYGVSLWLPEYYQKNDINTDEIGIYAISFFNAISNLPGNFISLWSVDSKYVGSRWTLIVRNCYRVTVLILLILISYAPCYRVVVLTSYSYRTNAAAARRSLVRAAMCCSRDVACALFIRCQFFLISSRLLVFWFLVSGF